MSYMATQLKVLMGKAFCLIAGTLHLLVTNKFISCMDNHVIGAISLWVPVEQLELDCFLKVKF